MSNKDYIEASNLLNQTQIEINKVSWSEWIYNINLNLYSIISSNPLTTLTLVISTLLLIYNRENIYSIYQWFFSKPDPSSGPDKALKKNTDDIIELNKMIKNLSIDIATIVNGIISKRLNNIKNLSENEILDMISRLLGDRVNDIYGRLENLDTAKVNVRNILNEIYPIIQDIIRRRRLGDDDEHKDNSIARRK